MTAELHAWEVHDPAVWDEFVRAAAYRSFPQLWAWGELRAAFGWQPVRLAVGESRDAPLAGAQVLMRATPLLGWRLGYAPRGPLGDLDDPIVRRALFSALHWLGRRERIATLKVDPEASPESGYGAALLRSPWRASDWVQPPRTRVVDLIAGEEALLAGLHHKHRQYVRKAEREGIGVEFLPGDVDEATTAQALADFHRIYADTALRAGFVAREAHYYQQAWALFAPRGQAWLAFATQNGERVATLFGFVCGDRAAEAYGGMTEAGAATRANYLLKWEAIRHFAQAGAATYDLWGLATGGIAHFKEGFGGRQLDYVGARDLPLRPVGDAALRVLQPAYGLAQRVRLRLMGRRLAGRGAADGAPAEGL